MIMKLNYQTLVLFVIVGISSCKKDPAPLPLTKANIVGTVNLYDEGKILIDKSGMKVTVVGTTPVISTISDGNGKYVLTDVPFGKYTLSYEKSGFGAFKQIGLQHTNTGSATIITDAPSLGQSSSTQVTALTVNTVGKDVILTITTNPAGSNANTRYIRYFLSTSATVNADNYSYFSPGFVSQINPKTVTLTTANLTDAGFSAGQTIYVKAYGDSFWSNDYEPSTVGKKVFPNLNITSSSAVSFVMP